MKAIIEGLLFLKGSDGLTFYEMKEILECENDEELKKCIKELYKDYSESERQADLDDIERINKELDLLKENEVFLEGDFTLSSGKKSNYYINMKKAITEPEILSTISKLITEKIKDEDIDKVAGPALGAVPIATAVSLESGLPLLMIRKEKKGYGTSKLIEGELLEGDDVIVVEDVSTTGGSLLKAIKAIQDNGGNVKRAFVVVDRQEGAIEEFEKEGITLEPLISVDEFFN